jgi:hypothetical protein
MIRPEDMGHETRVFQISIPNGVSNLKVCIGKRFDHEGRDRYTVYEVEGSRVKGPIGYYDLDKDTDVIDHEDTEKKGDFNVLKFGPPTFTNAKVEKEPVQKEKEETKEEPVSSSKFNKIITTTGGDCFYDAVNRAMKGTSDFDEDQVQQLRNELADYIESKLSDTIIDYYKQQIQSKSTAKVSVKDSHDVLVMLRDYFDDNKDLDEDTIVPTFIKNLKTMGTWANDLIINAFEKLKDVKLLLLHGKSKDSVENYKSFEMHLDYTPRSTTKYILLDYDPEVHFKLISLKASGNDTVLFEWEDIPSFIREKFSKFHWYAMALSPPYHVPTPPKAKTLSVKAKTIPVKVKTPESSNESSEEESSEEESSEEETPPVRKKLVIKHSEKEPEIVPDVVDLEPEQPEPEPVNEEESVNEDVPPPVEPSSEKEPEKEKSRAKRAKKDNEPLQVGKEYSREDLNSYSLKDLEEHVKKVAPTIAPKGKGKDFLIDCIINPNDPKCSSSRKKGSKEGGKFTRKNKTQ